MPRDFYATMVQVLPVLLIALVFDSGYLKRLRTQRRQRKTRSNRDGDVLIWTKPLVRVYGLTVTAILILDILLCVVMLADYLPDSVGLRAAVMGGAALVAVTLLFRIWFDIIHATGNTSEASDS